jgi:hypothetical protein
MSHLRFFSLLLQHRIYSLNKLRNTKLMTSNVVVAHKPENFLSHYSIYFNCHHLCAFKLCTVYLSFFHERGDKPTKARQKKSLLFADFFRR